MIFAPQEYLFCDYCTIYKLFVAKLRLKFIGSDWKVLMKKGERLGRYIIKKKIGYGGMGEVYLARDEQLDRDVALKVLLPEFGSDKERVKRFRFEAKAASALNHPNIITIHEIVLEGEQLFIATEFVDGVTLRKRIEKGDLTLFESIRIAEQVADALAIAHDAHIVHRDIKPENIMIRRDDYVKVLDFGLAKPIFLQQSGAEDETIQLVKTQPGLVMGSVRYMSPEQARGKETDESTDVWSLGVVLYEMLSGDNPFDGETISDSLAALIHIEPKALDNVPERMSWIISKALRKDPKERYQNIRDFALDLKDARLEMERDSIAHKTSGFAKTTGLPRHDTGENKTLIHRTISAETNTAEQTTSINPTLVNTISRGVGMKFFSAAFIILAASVAFGAWYYLPTILGDGTSGFESIRVSRLTNSGNAYNATVSPSGKMVAYINIANGESKLVVRQIATGSQVDVVSGTDRQFMHPTFSPDGEFIYYVLLEKGIGTLYKVSTLGGQSTKIADDVDSKAAVSPDGKRLAFKRHHPLKGGDTILIVENDGSNLTPLINTKTVKYDEFDTIVWTNDPKILMLSAATVTSQPSKKVNVITVNVESQEFDSPEKLDEINNGVWSAASRFVWLKDDSGIIFIGKKNADDTMQIWNLSFATGKVKSLTTDTNDYFSLSISDDLKTLVAAKVERISSLLAYDVKTKQTKQILGESKTFVGHVGISQTTDGKILYSKMTGKEVNIFSLHEDGSKEKQLTSNNRLNVFPVATPDGKYIVFSSNRNGSMGIWRMDSDGANPIQLSAHDSARDAYPHLINGAKDVIFTRMRNDGGKASLMVVPIDGGDARPMFPGSQENEIHSEVSADGKSLAFMTYEYDKEAAKVETFLRFASLSGEKVELTNGKMSFDVKQRFKWSPNGKNITYLSKANDNVWTRPLNGGDATALTNFDSGIVMNFAWSNDGTKVFVVKGIISSDLVLIKDIADE